ncbi:hypothetical protein [Luteimonas padinae]|uniref:Uncharacterized protein n=1 Tax=Luteimonas padinae TaxID=1714359 RepID=A0ABV6SUX8_9GAMM|nr:hypothetical protein [Luteimonas padinae]
MKVMGVPFLPRIYADRGGFARIGRKALFSTDDADPAEAGLMRGTTERTASERGVGPGHDRIRVIRAIHVIRGQAFSFPALSVQIRLDPRKSVAKLLLLFLTSAP